MKLLLVEDDAKLAATVRRGLEAVGLGVDVAADGLDGLWMATEGDYDVVVLDILLPGLNGFAVCRELRDRDNWVPILMLTAKSGELDEAEAIDTGADDYLTKPFSFAVLQAASGPCRDASPTARWRGWPLVTWPSTPLAGRRGAVTSSCA